MKSVMGEGENPSWYRGASRPVEKVSWFDCDICEKEGLKKCMRSPMKWWKLVRIKQKGMMKM